MEFIVHIVYDLIYCNNEERTIREKVVAIFFGLGPVLIATSYLLTKIF